MISCKTGVNIKYFEYLTIIPFLASVNMLFNFLYLNSMKMYKERMNTMIIVGIVNFFLVITLLKMNFEIKLYHMFQRFYYDYSEQKK